jgi:endonuclease/exonuclease/phosphatase family metal-dependent hydrolase
MKKQTASFFVIALVLGFAFSAGPPAEAQENSGTDLKVMTFNVWHGLRSGESRKRFPGEDAERAAERFDWQIEEIKRLDPDVLLFQEVNPNQPQSRRYAEALGYDEIHKVTSCGLHLGAIYKIPKNVNEGIAILAKPELSLQRAGKKRLSGNAMCSATWGFQTKESRYALFGVIAVGGQKVLLVTTHLAAPAFVPAGFDDQLEKMVEEGILTAEQRGEILAERDRKQDRNLGETERLLKEIARHQGRLASNGANPPTILGGDFNAEPEYPGIATVRKAGWTEAATGPDFQTWNPVENHVNYGIGTKRHFSLPTFDNPQVEAMLDERHDTPRQIDHIFLSPKIRVVSAEMAMNEPKDGIYPSDHFGLLVELQLP